MSPQENSEAAKRELCARFDALAALLEEKKAELLQRISQEQADKTAFIQSLICQYKEQLEKSSRLVETAIQAAEETGGAAFLMVSPPNLPPPRCARWGPAVGVTWWLLWLHSPPSPPSSPSPSPSLSPQNAKQLIKT